MTLEILKTKTVGGKIYQLQRCSQLSYFSKSGKARLAIKTDYHVERCESVELSLTIDDPANRYGIGKKSDALRHFNSIKG